MRAKSSGKLRTLALSAALLLICSAAVGSTLTDYEHRVATSATLIEQLAGAYEDEGHSEPSTLQGNLDRLRQMLPAKETVEWGQQRVVVDNSWLHESLAEYENTANQTKRAEILMRTAERLRALEDRLKAIQAGKISTSDKDSNQGRLAEILRRPEYIQTAPEASALDRLIERFVRWLSKLFPKTEPIQPGGSPAVSGIAQILILGVSLAAIALVIWRYGPRFRRGRGKKKTKREARIVLGERLDPDQTAADLLAQAESLARGGDLRAAIRKAYIALLCELGDRKLISLAQHKTNRDYLNSVRDKGSLYAAMRKLTHAFELHWYGFLPPVEADWTEFRNGYRRIVTSDK